MTSYAIYLGPEVPKDTSGRPGREQICTSDLAWMSRPGLAVFWCESETTYFPKLGEFPSGEHVSIFYISLFLQQIQVDIRKGLKLAKPEGFRSFRSKPNGNGGVLERLESAGATPYAGASERANWFRMEKWADPDHP